MLRLVPHPDGGAGAVDAIDVAVSLDETGALWLRFHVECDPDIIETGDYRESVERADELWRGTCFEAFVRRTGESGYTEFNFAPDNRWAAYRFDGYRSDMEDQPLVAPPALGLDSSDNHLVLEASLALPDHLVDVPLCIGLSAIIAQTDGSKSYWALVHPSGKPDFHHDDCFALDLKAGKTS